MDSSAPGATVASFQFRSAGVAVDSIWAPIGQETEIGVFGYDAAGVPATRGGIALRVSDPSIAEVLVAGGIADGGSASATVRGKQAGITMLIATAANGAVDSTRIRVPSVGGVYDVTTQLQTFSFETPAPSPPDCPGSTLYCTHVRDFTGAALSGTLTVQKDSVFGNFGGLFCSTWSLEGCSAVKSIAASDYQYYSMTKSVSGLGHFYIGLEMKGDFLPAVFLDATASGDSLYGSVTWSQYVTRSPPTHYGTFVAHLRH